MNPEYPIYVISKGRSNRCLTARELDMMGVPYKLVIEPQEYADYAAAIDKDKILVLPFSNLGQGSIPARNWVWEHSISIGAKKHWILDDNLEGFHRLNKNIKPKVTSGTIFKCAEDFTDRYSNVAISGFNYYSFCKTTDRVPPFYLNTRIYSCILIRNDILYKWRGKFNEDTDLSLRVLKDGWCTILFNAFLVGKVTTMRMKGGNTEQVYGDTDNRREFAESLKAQHPDIVKVVWKFNRWHHQVNYKPFKKNKLIKKKELVTPEGVNNYGMVLRRVET
ncbi:hypothetical protein KAR91_09840 [Candidatus Pacearchaeota archaeon]|nr:hypothetical protein [Candidatus Pacearchaeota archaeon]